MNQSKLILIAFTILSATILPISYVHGQTLSFGNSSTIPSNSAPTLISGSFSNSPIHTGILNSTLVVNNTAHIQIIFSGIVNVADQPNGKQVPSNNAIPSPHLKDPVAYANYVKQLNSGKIPNNMIPRVPETPIANVSKNPHADPIQIANSGFIGFEENTTNNLVVPDVQIATGSNYVLEMVNLEGGIWTKSGTVVKQFQLAKFFAFKSTDNISDPRVLYDFQSGRWFAELIDQSNSTASIAVSQTSDPTASWYLYKLPYYSASCIDFPKIGTSNDKFAISTNDFNTNCGLFTQSEIVVLDKTQLINNNLPITSSDVTDSTEFSVTPAKSLSSTFPLFMIANDPASSNNIIIYKLTGPAGSVVPSNNATTTATNQNDPPLVPQPGTTAALKTPPHGFEDASWFNGKLWSAFTDACMPSQGFANHVYSCVHMINYNTNSGNGIDFEVANHNYNFSYPALSIDNAGGMDVIFSYVSTTSYPGIYATGQTQYDPSNSVEPLVQIQAGSNYDASCRYGDYFGAAVDPSQPLIVWIAGEYHHLTSTGPTQCFGGTTSPDWSTYIASVSLWCVTPTSGDWTITSSCILGSNFNPPGNVFVSNNALLTIPNGVTLGIDFVSHKLLVNSGSGILINPGGKIN